MHRHLLLLLTDAHKVQTDEMNTDSDGEPPRLAFAAFQFVVLI